jgi:hypothetical protein
MNLRLTEESNQFIVRSESGNLLKIYKKEDLVVVEINGVTFSISRRDVPRFVSLMQLACD